MEAPLTSMDLFAGPGEDEFVPVDAFFQSYIEELSRSKRGHEPGGADIIKAAKLNAGQTAGGALHPSLLQPRSGGAGGMQPPYPGGSAPLPGAAQHPSMLLPGVGLLPQIVLAGPQVGGVAPTAQGQPLGRLGGQAGLPAGFPAAPSPSPYPVALSGGMAPLYGGAGYLGAPAPAAQLSGGGGGGDDSGSHGDSKHRKTARQQEANKIAQQRYRQRKKEKFADMEAQIGQLSRQLAALQALQTRNSMLEGLNGELQAQLMSREKEVERLKLALDVSAERSLSGGSHSHPSSPSGEADRYLAPEAGDEACAPTANACDLLPQDLAGIDFKKGFADQVALLREFVQQHGLTQGAVPDHGMSQQEVMQLGQLVARSCQLCQAALRAEGVRVMELISKDPNSFSTVDSVLEAQRWGACLEVMHLTPQQQEVLLLNRRAHLQRMRGIYEERQALNMQAMSLMLPHSSTNPAEDNTVEGRLANMSKAGYLQVARSSAQLGEVLDRIKDNLRREQRAVMDLNCQLVSKILSPLQSAHYMIKAYPQHCDALALSNTLAKHLGRVEFDDSVPLPAPQPSSGCRQQEVGCC